MQINSIIELLLHANYLWIFIVFLGLGLLLAMTPCILPMIPILSAIIVGQRQFINTRRAFYLSLSYVLGISITYMIAGIIAAKIGGSVQAFFQSPWVLVLLSGLFVLLALSLFDYYELQLPSFLSNRLQKILQHQRGGTYWGVACMGAISALIVSPCVTAPLVGVLTYIAKTGDQLLGGLALFGLGFGMGLPLLIVGTLGGKILPKAGPWMVFIKRLFGWLMLGLAIFLLSRLLPSFVTLLLWLILIVAASWSLVRTWRLIGIVTLFIVITLFSITVIHFNKNEGIFSSKSALIFTPIKTIDDLNQSLRTAKEQHKFALLDFYADWCLSCQEMDRSIFSNSETKKALQNFILLRADITRNDAQDRALMKNLHVIAPPTILFFDANGREIQKLRIVGDVNRQQFLETIQQVKQ